MCAAGTARPENCAAGKYTDTGKTAADKNSCTACDAGFGCPGYGGKIACKEGYFSAGSLEKCSQTPDGSYRGTGDAASAAKKATAGNWALPGDIVGTKKCPRGYHCDGTTKA